MKVVDKFDFDCGVWFFIYVVWWIKVSIQDFVMWNWLMVCIGLISS